MKHYTNLKDLRKKWKTRLTTQDKDGLLTEIERKYNLGIPSKISNILRVLDNTSPAGVKQNIEYALQLLNAENYERVIELCETISKSLASISIVLYGLFCFIQIWYKLQDLLNDLLRHMKNLYDIAVESL